MFRSQRRTASARKTLTGQFLQPGQSLKIYFYGEETGSIPFTMDLVGKSAPEWPVAVTPTAGLAITF